MSHLFESIVINGREFPNRLVMPPMATNKATDDGKVVQEIIEHYKKRAEADVGTIIVEHTYVTPEGRVNNQQMGAHRCDQKHGLSKLADAITSAGSKAIIQLTHAGASGVGDEDGPCGAGSIPRPGKENVPRPMTIDELQKLKEQFANSAAMCIDAGFDGVELHGAHGYLLNQFLSSLTNDRDDQYGGDFSGRSRYPLEVVKSVREKLGDDALLYYRLGADDHIDGGVTTDETAPFAQMLVDRGVDVLDISGGLGGYRVSEETKEGYFLPEVLDIKRHLETQTSVILTGGIINAESADKLVAEEGVDFVGVGRGLLMDPYWGTKARRLLTS